MVTPIANLQSYLDESSDEMRKDVLCVGGFMAYEEDWTAMQEVWRERLRVPDEISYFRATSCKGIHESFFKLRKKYIDDARSVADKVRADLEDILLSRPWRGFGIGVLVPDYNAVWQAYPLARRMFRKDPVESAFAVMFCEIARAAQDVSSENRVAFTIDDSTYSGIIAEAFKGVKVNHPGLARSMATLEPLDDKVTPPLQMADLLASVVRDTFLEWLKVGRPQYIPMKEKWSNHFQLVGMWDKEYMLMNMVDTIDDPRFQTKQLALRTAPERTGAELRREEKRRRKALIRRYRHGDK
jgi:hypothetical protein